MRKTFFTVGPTQLHPRLGELMTEALREDIASISHRGPEFQSLFARTVDSLQQLFKLPANFHIFFLSSATEAMERIVENCVEKQSFHFVNGAFSKRFFTAAGELKKGAEKIEVRGGESFDFSGVEIPSDAELVCLTQNETSTGVAIDTREIELLKQRFPHAIFALDVVSSVPYVDVDYSLIDCAFFSVQKGFGLPAGLGVLFVNGRCIEKARELQNKGISIGTYHSFLSLLKCAEKRETPETPNILGIHLLSEIAKIYLDQGIDTIRKDTDRKSERLYDFFDRHVSLKPFVKNKAWRSKTVVTIETPSGSGPILEACRSKGFVVGRGYGEFRDKHVRIGNFPTHSFEDVESLLHALE